MAQIWDGRLVAKKLAEKIRVEILELRQKSPKLPQAGLAILQVGNNPASETYIRHKLKLAEEIGIKATHTHLAADSSESEIEKALDSLNKDLSVHGIIIQLPLDQSIPSSATWVHSLIDKILPQKDADGLHTLNLGKLFAAESTSQNWQSPLPATALGVMRILEHYNFDPKAKNCLVVGKSRLVGNPTAQLLLQAGAAVSVVHSKSGDWSKWAQNADLIVMAAGVKHLLKPSQLSPQSVVIDVGIHRENEGLTGDVAPACYPHLKAYTPVPGGVGPLTVVCLMENVFCLWKKSETALRQT